MSAPDCTCPSRLGCHMHDGYTKALDGACIQLLEMLDKHGASSAELSVASDGRVSIRLLSDSGYLLRHVRADLVLGSSLERPSVAIAELIDKGSRDGK